MALPTVQDLKELGFDAAANKVEKSTALLAKMSDAYANFEHVTIEDIDKFKAELRKKTEKTEKYKTTYDTLVFHSINSYTEAPPSDVLEKLKAAKAFGCFDTFEIAKIESVEEVKDPILFGCINGCGDKFYIAQWDDDVTIEAIKKAAGR